MKHAINIYLSFTVCVLFFLPAKMIKAEEFYASSRYQPYQVTQSHADEHEFELSSGQIRSRVEHKLINFILGQSVDQYLEFGADDDVAQKSSKQLKLRLNRHHLFLVYRLRFQ